MISTTTSRGVAHALAERFAGAAHATARPVVADIVRRRVFDALGALAAGRGIADHALFAALPERGLLADVRRLCAVIRSTEVDDLDRLSCTSPGSVAVPVSLLVAAWRGLGEEELLAGVAAGYEAMAGIGQALGGPHRLPDGVWPSYDAAPLAAAAASAAVLGLDGDRAAHALAIAVARTPGRAGRIAGEPTSRWLGYGSAAADGVVATLAAEAGAHGDLALLDLPALRVDPPPQAQWLVERADVKPFCTARQTQSAVEAARMTAMDLQGATIVEAEVAVPAAYRAMIDQPRPRTRLASIASAQFQLSAALTSEGVLWDVVRASPAPPAVAMRVIVDGRLSALYPEAWPARVRLRTAGGDEATRTILGGDEPLPGWHQLFTKHARLGALAPPELDALRAACRSIAPGELLHLADPERTR
ncbi:MmgE/PrpD family protein [Solirubrobacter ginsenosidimutans]|uniref:MmgE/PrpD family protein n=1 Tax=Solirubrobacter ginsenosidimutans TaxID=490573 RepID=A0A9X3MPJ7_9ACTN|nr:MmgE/PrpD family protein [Solirubrobacter ginsenosidimutans]MDA0158898.1 MmgE/PrpD family protein [Solirubrobacter ginsenosidimutans]